MDPMGNDKQRNLMKKLHAKRRSKTSSDNLLLLKLAKLKKQVGRLVSIGMASNNLGYFGEFSSK